MERRTNPTCATAQSRRVAPRTQVGTTGVLHGGHCPGALGKGLRLGQHTVTRARSLGHKDEHKTKRLSITRLVCTHGAQGAAPGMTEVQHCRNPHSPAVNLPIFIY